MPKIVFKNILDTINSLISHASTTAREWVFPDKNGTVALLDDTQSEEFNRAFSEDIIFDKNDIFYAIHNLTGDLNYTIGSGSLANFSSSARQKITTDGTHAINFGAGFDFLYGIQNGQILEAGTYEIYFLFENGSVSVNFPATSQQSSSLIQLATPANFSAASDGEDEVDLSWDVVANASSYRVEYSLTGTGGWSVLSTPSAATDTEVHTGLTPGTTYYYRIKANGDGITYSDSPYSSSSATTSSGGGDVTAPTFIFAPASGDTSWAMNQPITVTANEPIRNTDGTAITNANVASRLTVKQTNSGGSNIAFTATIDITKTIITITPTTSFGASQLVYVAINNVEDNTGNEVTTAISSTFTTTNFTYFDGTHFVNYGDIAGLESLWNSVDTNFWLGVTIKNPTLSGFKTIIGKTSPSTSQRAFSWVQSGSDILFIWNNRTTGAQRVVKWTGALADTAEHALILKYDASIDTNNGLDRVILTIDGVTAGSKTMDSASGALFDIVNADAPLVIGAAVNSSVVATGNFYAGEMKDFFVKSNNGATNEILVPNIRTGLDTSGNGRHGAWL
jgi:hypothetical protein